MTATSFAAHQIHSARYAEAETRASEKNLKNQAEGQKESVPTGETPSRGAEGQSDPVIIVEWADFRCGHCKMLADTLKAALKTDPAAFRYHFRHFPLDRTCNPTWSEDVAPGNSCLAAYAMVCADQQGQAWALHDRLFENQTGFQNQHTPEAALSMLNAIAQDIGLDMNRFAACLD